MLKKLESAVNLANSGSSEEKVFMTKLGKQLVWL
jgi:hypothetical protein